MMSTIEQDYDAYRRRRKLLLEEHYFRNFRINSTMQLLNWHQCDLLSVGFVREINPKKALPEINGIIQFVAEYAYNHDNYIQDAQVFRDNGYVFESEGYELKHHFIPGMYVLIAS